MADMGPHLVNSVCAFADLLERPGFDAKALIVSRVDIESHVCGGADRYLSMLAFFKKQRATQFSELFEGDVNRGQRPYQYSFNADPAHLV